MAEPTAPPAPALPSTADTIPYVPVSWLAVAAAGVSGTFLLLLAGLGVLAFRGRKPLLAPELLILAVAGIVLSFAARRVIRNSEGTRTGVANGIDLPNAAWWTALVLGLGYTSYLVAIDYSIRRDARAEVQRWADYLVKGDAEARGRAFWRTRDPGERARVKPDDRAYMEGRWGVEFVGLEKGDLARLVERNPGRTTFAVGGLKNWAHTPGGVECVFTGTFKCPEGSFPIQVPLRGVEPAPGSEAVGRQWQIVYNPTGYIQQDQVRRTPYGWFVAAAMRNGQEYAFGFASQCIAGRDYRPGAFFEYLGADTRPGDPGFPLYRALTVAGLNARCAAVGVPAGVAWTPGQEFFQYTADRLFTLPGGKAPADDEKGRAQKKTFADVWSTTGFVKPGERIKENADKTEELAFDDTTIYLRLPVELPLSSTRAEVTAARGRLVVACADPAAVAEATRLREAAATDAETAAPPTGFRPKPLAWKILWVESDLKAVVTKAPAPLAPPGAGPQAMGP